MKRCPKCATEKPKTDFYKDRTRKDGLSAICRDCRTAARRADAEYYAAWRAANPDKVHANNRRAYERADKDAERERLRRYRYENHLYVLERERKARDRNLERERARRKRWAQRNPEKIKQIRRRVNDSRRGVRPSASAESFALVLAGDPCAYCGAPCGEMDHIVPVVLGGSGGWDNLTASCGSCNRRKNRTPLLIFLSRSTTDFSPA